MIYKDQIETAKKHLAHVDHELKRQAKMHADHSRTTYNTRAREAAIKLEKQCLDCADAVREMRFDDIRHDFSLSIVFGTAVDRVKRDLGIITKD